LFGRYPDLAVEFDFDWAFPRMGKASEASYTFTPGVLEALQLDLEAACRKTI
jgi:hypothetical protein